MGQEPPAELFKYASWDACEKILAGKSLKATPAGDLNDPFECCPGGYEEIRDAELDLLVQARSGRVRQQFLDAGCSLAELDHCAAGRASDVQRAAGRDRLRRDVEAEGPGKIEAEVSRLFGIICFSEARDSLLMWSHYADRHRGVCIGYRPAELSGAGRPAWLKVAYSHARPRLIFRAAPGDDAYQANAVRVVGTKACSWCYEKEWRLLVRLCQCRLAPQMRLWSFQPSAITRVILGCAHQQAPGASLAEIRRILPKAPVQQARRHPREYSLLLETLPDQDVPQTHADP